MQSVNGATRKGREGDEISHRLTGIEVPRYMLYITNLAVYRAMEAMVVRRCKAEDGNTRVLEGGHFRRICWEIQEIWDVEVCPFDPAPSHSRSTHRNELGRQMWVVHQKAFAVSTEV